MKQMEECIERFQNDKMPIPSKKWKAFKTFDSYCRPLLKLFHYHHLILVLDIQEEKVVYEWWQRPADKRGLDDAKAILKREGVLNNL